MYIHICIRRTLFHCMLLILLVLKVCVKSGKAKKYYNFRNIKYDGSYSGREAMFEIKLYGILLL